MQTTLSIDFESPNWLRSLRWAAILGMSGSVFGAFLYGFQLPWISLCSLLFCLAVWNAFLPKLEEKFFESSDNYVIFQILVDLCVLTAMLWNSGGFVNPFVSFYIFHVMIAGLLLTSTYTILVSFAASVLVLALIWAPGMQMRDGRRLVLQDSPIWAGVPIGLLLLIVLTNVFILAFLYRLRRMQGEREQRNKMTALGRLVGGMAHEIGTPLNSILVIAKDMEAVAPAEMKKELQTIHQQARRCGNLVSLLLGYSRGSGSPGVEYKAVDLEPWLKEIFPSLQSTVVFDNVPKVLQLPELVLRQVFLNIFKNAQHATRHLLVPEVRVVVRRDSLESAFIFDVSDNGQGFSEQARERAFEAFFTTKEPGDGIGLGLYISYHLMEQVGGRISIESSLEGNSFLRIWVPYAK